MGVQKVGVMAVHWADLLVAAKADLKVVLLDISMVGLKAVSLVEKMVETLVI